MNPKWDMWRRTWFALGQIIGLNLRERNRNGKVRGLAYTKAAALWIWAFLVQRTVDSKAAETRENRIKALDF